MNVLRVSFLLSLLIAAGCPPSPTSRPRPEADRAEILLERGQPDAAVEALSRAIEAEPEAADLYFRRARIYESVGQIEAAAADYTGVLKREPRHADALNNRGTIRARMGDLPSAIADLTAAVDADPGNPLYRSNRAQAFIDRGEGRAAEDDLRVVDRITPGDPLTALRLGDALRLQQRDGEAVDTLRRAATAAAGDADLLVRIGRSLAGVNAFVEAGRAASAAADLDPTLRLDEEVSAVITRGRIAAACRATGLTPRPSSPESTAVLVAERGGERSPVFAAVRTSQAIVIAAAAVDEFRRSGGGGWVAVPAGEGYLLKPAGDVLAEEMPAASFFVQRVTTAPPPVSNDGGVPDARSPMPPQ